MTSTAAVPFPVRSWIWPAATMLAAVACVLALWLRFARQETGGNDVEVGWSVLAFAPFILAVPFVILLGRAGEHTLLWAAARRPGRALLRALLWAVPMVVLLAAVLVGVVLFPAPGVDGGLKVIVGWLLLITAVTAVVFWVRGTSRATGRRRAHLAETNPVALARRRQQSAHRDAWRRAQAAYDDVVQRRMPETTHPLDVMLQEGETVFLDAPLQYARYYGADVQYTQRTMLLFGSPLFVAGGMAASAIGNASARSRAEALARHQWRELQTARVILTDRRLWIRTVDSWLTFDHGAVAQFLPAPGHWQLVIDYQGVAPLMLSGVAAPHAAVVMQSILRGPDSLAQIVAFEPFRQDRDTARGFGRDDEDRLPATGAS